LCSLTSTLQFIQAGISPLLQKQLEDLAKRNVNGNTSNNENKGSQFVIGQDRVEPLQALQDSGQEVSFSIDIYVTHNQNQVSKLCVVHISVAFVCIFFCPFSYLLLILCCQICVNMDKQREKRRLAENWRRKKHEEKKSNFLSSFFSNSLRLHSCISSGHGAAIIHLSIFKRNARSLHSTFISYTCHSYNNADEHWILSGSVRAFIFQKCP
jgi:hypothetical protein